MKNILFTTATLFLFTLTFGQTNFKWDKVDSIQKTKSKIYSDTKMFIAETWKSSKDVVQNDDKDEGIILIKASTIKKVPHMGGDYVYVYNYNVTFKMKDNKYKIILDNVYCESAYASPTYSVHQKIEPFDGDNCPELITTLTEFALPKKKAIALMTSLKNELQIVVDNYDKYIKTTSKNDDGW
jgi:hypothetical protein